MMGRRKVFISLIGISLAAACMLTACNLPQAAAADLASATVPPTPIAPTATSTAVPTSTKTTTPTPTFTLAPTPTQTPTPELTPQVAPAMNAFCRKGPGIGYHAITYLKRGTYYKILGQNGFSGRYTWWLIQAPGNFACWMGGTTSGLQGPVRQVPVATAPPLPEKLTTYIVSVLCTSTSHSLLVVLDWEPVENVTGYNVYRNGSLLAVLAPNAKAYQDKNAPLAVELEYSLEPFNDYGTSSSKSGKVSACGD
jgi:hypothetical protein